MTKPGFCSMCNFETIVFGDVKPYLLDRTDEFALYSKESENFTIMCCNCWKEQDEMDKLLYGEMKIPIKALTWDKPLPKDNQETSPTIIKNIVINNNTNNNTNINYNTSNITPTYNTTNNTNKITQIKDPDNIINSLSSNYNKVLRKANKMKTQRIKEEIKKQKLAKQEELLKTNEQMKQQKMMEQYEHLKKLEEETQQEQEQCKMREKEQLEMEKRKNELHDDKIKLEIKTRKQLNTEKRNKKNSEIETIEKEYNVSFSDCLFVEQPNEILKKYNKGFLSRSCCHKCKVIKAYPNDFVDKFNNLNEERDNDLCTECIIVKSQKEIDNKSYNMVKCSCGVTYYGATFEARHKHENSQRHIKA